jgi:hypothetical protein
MHSFLHGVHRRLSLVVAAVLLAFAAQSGQSLYAQCQCAWQYGAMGITNFTLTQAGSPVINRSSGCDINTAGGVATPNGVWQTGVTGNVQLGKVYNFSISGLSWPTSGTTNSYSFCYAIWIDLNGNGNFETNAGERVAVNSAGQYFYPTATGSFTLPCSAASGQLKMRVMGLYYYDYNTGALGFQANDPCGNYFYGEAEDYTLNVLGDMGVTFPNQTSPNNILVPGSIYSGTNGGYVNVTTVAGQSAYVTYRIVGPLPSTNAVYTALNPANPNDTTVPCTGTGNYNQFFSSAKGPYAGAGGAIDLTGSNVVPGAYRLEASFVKSSGCSSFVAQNFYIPLPWDISVSKIIAPATNAAPQYYKYPRGVPIAISCRVQNVGQNTVNALRIIDEIRDQNGTIIRTDTLTYNNAVGLSTGQEVGSDAVNGGFPNFTTTTTGVYCVTFRTELIGVTDQQLSNNVQPSSGCHTFEVQYDIELSAEAFLNPTSSSSMFVGRPLRPAIRIRNNGLADASDIPATLVIKKDGQTVYTQSITIPDCSRGLTTGATFPFWTPNAVGAYQLCFYTSLTEDAIKTNDTLCINVNVGDALNGTYTIGTLNQGQARNFTTIQDAVNALYGAGLSGPTIFELTDASYTVGSGAAGFPAVDMTSRVAGASASNTVTFRPSLLQSLTRSSISIRLRSGNGVGFLFGQNYFPTNANAIQNTQPLASNANPAGYVVFDGGSQKSFRFMLDVGAATPTQLPHRAVFYLGNGTSNVTVKNCLIENFPQSTASYASSLPVVRYLAPNFTFETDVRQLSSGPDSYAAGIVARSVAPSNQGNNSLGLDTLTNNYNQFVNNEISGFGYGIVSLGVGPLFYNDIATNGNPRFQRYYNKGTVISGNIISSVRRAGIFTGYGESETISNNRILNVGQGATGITGQAAGIMVGGEARTNQLCYNSIKATITRNEVSNISSDVAAQGIYVEQTLNSFVNPAGGNVSFPNVNEASVVSGNMVYALARTTQNAVTAGIHLLTTRSLTATGLNKLITPQIAAYNTRGDSVVNNTVLVTGDAVSNGNSLVGIGIQQATNAVMINNAIAVSASASSVNTAAGNVLACLFYQGTSPKASSGVAGLLPAVSGGLTSNRNAFFAPNAAVVRYIETDANNSILTLGSQSDYMTLGQWKGWTAQDINSVVGNFVNDHVASTSSPSRLRISTNPVPIGSVLDRRGERIGANIYDLDGQPRGLNGARFTIGADEFIGRLYVNDVEAIEIIDPVSYRAGSGNFADAEYVMTKAPINVTARMRNNGSANQSGVTIVAEIRDQNNAVVATNSKQVTIASGESADINFDFNYTPMTYSDMGQSAPAPFTTMGRNITPVYTINVSTPIDENVANNAAAKPVRFYLMRSPIRMMNSVVGTTIDPNNAATPFNDIVGRLNADTLAKALTYIGMTGTAYDLFDRNGWEPRAVNYGGWRTLFWSGDTNRLTRQQRTDLRMFLATGTASDKRNLIAASQEILGKHIGVDATNDEQFVRNVFRATNATTGALKGSAPTDRTPRSAGYNGNLVQGLTIALGVREGIASTTNMYDGALPRPSLMRIYSDNQTNGLARGAYYYVTRDAGVTDSLMGVANNSLNYNVVFLGVDWRHMPRSAVNSGSERVLRGIIEFIERSNGTVVPVELVSFNAQRAGANVNVAWETASEKNSSHFDVERAAVTAKGMEAYTLVQSVAAQGTSTVSKEYSVLDANVSTVSAWSYRLKMVDLDGTSKYSQEVLVAGDGASDAVVVTPNPANDVMTVEVRLEGTGAAEVALVDVQGRTVQTIAQGEMSGMQRFTVNVDSLASGTYSVVVKQQGTVRAQTLRIIK